MQYWQRKFEQNGFANTLNNVNDILLPSSGLLGSLLIKISGAEATGLGASGGAWRLIDYLSKIEVIVNGSVVVKSFDGFTADALATLDQGVMPPSNWRNYATNVQYDYVLINFGRKLWDTMFQLDLSKYDNVHLRITNSATTASFSDFTTTVVGYYLREKSGGQASPGYFRTEEWRRWTTVADDTQYLRQFPTEYLVRRIMLRAVPSVDGNNIASTGMHNLMDSIQLYFKTGDITVYDGSLEMLIHDNYLGRGATNLIGSSPYHTSGKGVRMDIGRTLGIANGAGTQAGTVATVDNTFESARTDFTQVAYSFQADHPGNLLAYGAAPFEAAWFSFDDYDDPANYLDPDAYKDVQLNIHTRNLAGAASGQNTVILDRLVKY